MQRLSDGEAEMEMMLILNTTIAAETRAAWPRATVLRWIARASMA
ncbi:hypothetical protein [Brevibacterium sp. RIT 803]|nr:hypothetical protein [Brevibacterium sp. RIT 803]